jgi:hypothetical protein
MLNLLCNRCNNKQTKSFFDIFLFYDNFGQLVYYWNCNWCRHGIREYINQKGNLVRLEYGDCHKNFVTIKEYQTLKQTRFDDNPLTQNL